MTRGRPQAACALAKDLKLPGLGVRVWGLGSGVALDVHDITQLAEGPQLQVYVSMDPISSHSFEPASMITYARREWWDNWRVQWCGFFLFFVAFTQECPAQELILDAAV